MDFVSVPREGLSENLRAQLRLVSPSAKYRKLAESVETALERVRCCFAPIVLPGYRRSGKPVFDSSHGDQYAAFLYFVSNSAWAFHSDSDLAVDCFRLNKALNGLNCMYDTRLPEVFALIHTVGMVLGKADYGNRFVAYQNVTVGTDHGVQPSIGSNAVLFGGSMIIGACKLGDRVVVSANSTVINTDIPSDSVAAGSFPNLLVKPRRRNFEIDYFEK